MDWTTIITIVLGSSLLGAILNNFVSWLIKSSEQLNRAKYIALNLAHMFEKYAYECLSATNEHDLAESSGGDSGMYIKKIPKLPDLPEYDYRVFDLALLDKVFEFPQQIGFASESYSFAIEILDGEDALKVGYDSCLQLAQEALDLADAIRGKYKMKKRSLKFGEYSVREELKEKQSR